MYWRHHCLFVYYLSNFLNILVTVRGVREKWQRSLTTVYAEQASLMMPTLEVNVDALKQITVRHSLLTIITTDIQSKNVTIAAVLYFPKTSFDLCHSSLDSPFFLPPQHPACPGGVLKKVLYREAPPRGPTPYPFIYHFFRKGTPFVYLLLEKGIPFIYLLKKIQE